MSDLDAAVTALRAGDPIVIATDTVYGLAARAADRAAVAAIFALKERPVDRHVAVLVADVAQAADYVVADDPGFRALARRFWPGPLTIVAHRCDRGALAAGDERTMGVRCPADEFVRALAAAVGPIAATSANRHGEPTPTTAPAVAAIFPSVEVVIDGGPREGSASTVVSVVDGAPRVLRDGPITASDIADAVERDS